MIQSLPFHRFCVRLSECVCKANKNQRIFIRLKMWIKIDNFRRAILTFLMDLEYKAFWKRFKYLTDMHDNKFLLQNRTNWKKDREHSISKPLMFYIWVEHSTLYFIARCVAACTILNLLYVVAKPFIFF